MEDFKLPDNAHAIDLIIKQFNFKLGAEIGVREGNFTTSLLKNNKDLVMYAIDLWAYHPSMDEQNKHEENYYSFVTKVAPMIDRVIIMKKLSCEAAKDIPDSSLDFVFIDATHTYLNLVKDIKLWYPKLKDTGLISGHDYHSSFDKGGMIKAIDKYIGINHIVKSTTMEDGKEEVLNHLKNNSGGVVDKTTTCWYCWKKDMKYFKDGRL